MASNKLMGDPRPLRAPASGAPFRIVLAEDDPDDRLLTRRAFEKSDFAGAFSAVEDGEALMDFLHRCASHASEGPLPDLILLDLNMPRMDGREVLRELKTDPGLQRIPVVVLTTSEAEHDVAESYDLGVNAFITKPVTFEGLVEATRQLGRFWFETAKLP